MKGAGGVRTRVAPVLGRDGVTMGSTWIAVGAAACGRGTTVEAWEASGRRETFVSGTTVRAARASPISSAVRKRRPGSFCSAFIKSVPTAGGRARSGRIFWGGGGTVCT